MKTAQFSTSEFEDILIYFSNSILGKNSKEEIAWDLANNCISQLGFYDCVVYFVNHQKNILEQKAAHGPKNPRQKEITSPIIIPVGEGICGAVAKTAKAELVSDTSKDERYIVDDEVRLSELTVPIIIDNQVFGVIDCEHPEKNFFSNQHLKILSAIASVCAIKIKNVESERKVLDEHQLLLETKMELLSLKIKALRVQMNPHFVFNAVNAIQHFITINDKRSSLNYLSTFSKLLRHHLNYFELDNVPIETEIQMLKWYMKLQKLRYDNKFDYVFDYENDKLIYAKKIPGMVLASAVEDIIENSMIEQVENLKVVLKIEIDNGRLNFQISFNSNSKKKERKQTYRDELTTWQEQIDLLNRLKDLDIEKKLEIYSENQRTISLSLPITDQ